MAEHVLMTADTVGGVWTYALDLARGLGAHGTRVTLAAIGPSPTAAQRGDALSVPSLDLRTFEGKLEWMDEPWSDVRRSADWLVELERETRPDLVHLNMYSHGVQPFAAPTLLVGHSCVLSWWSAVKNEDAPERFAEYRRSVRTALLTATCSVSVSLWMAEQLKDIYDLPYVPAVVENGRSTPEMVPARKDPFVFSCGRLWDEGKNIRVLDAAAALTPVPIYIAGDNRDSHFRAAKPLGWLPNEQIRDWLRHASVYAHPAVYEPFGLAVLEAALCGCALLLADIPSLRQLWSDAALFIDPADPRKWAAAIESLQDDEELRTTLARNARATALARSTEKMTEAYIHLYAGAQARRAAA